MEDRCEFDGFPAKFDLVSADAAHVRHVVDLQAKIAEGQRAEEALREANRRKSEFLAMLAHELRNPLAPNPQRGGDPAMVWGRRAESETGDRYDAASSWAIGASC